MSNVEKLNLEGWGWFTELLAWGLTGFWQMFFLLFFISIGVGELTRAFEFVFQDVHYFRPRFSAYLVGDVALAVVGGLAVKSVHEFDGGEGFYNNRAVYTSIFILSCLIAVGLEVDAVRQNKKNPLTGFTLEQELTPSKLAHTMAFGPILAILLCLIPYVAMNPYPVQVGSIVVLVAFWYLLDAKFDPRRVDPDPDPESLPVERTNKAYLFVKAHPHPSRDRQIRVWRESRLNEARAAV